MDPEADCPTEVGPDVAPNSVEKPTTEPATEPTPDIAADDATDPAQIIAEIVTEPSADVESQQASQSTPESTSKASAKSSSAAEIPLPPSPRPLPGFRYSSTFPRLLVPIERSIASDLRTSFGDGISRATEAPAVVTEDSGAAHSDASDDDAASFHTAPAHPIDDDQLEIHTYSGSTKLTTLYEIKRFRNRDFSKQQRRIIDALDLTLRPGGREAASEVAAEIDRLCPPKWKEEGVEDWLWMLWETVIDIVRFGSFEVERLMYEVVWHLQKRATRYVKIEGVEERLWTDLPMFSYCMEAYFNDPTTGKTDLRCEDEEAWWKLNGFAARCLQGGFGGPYHHAVHAMRSALEEEPSPHSRIFVCRLFVACSWMMLAGKILLRRALDNASRVEHPKEDSMDFEEPGPLYHGPPMICLRRWDFWVQRLKQLGKEFPEESDFRIMANFAWWAEQDNGYCLRDRDPQWTAPVTEK